MSNVLGNMLPLQPTRVQEVTRVQQNGTRHSATGIAALPIVTSVDFMSGGRCVDPDTRILMHDGSEKRVSSLKRSDIVST